MSEQSKSMADVTGNGLNANGPGVGDHRLSSLSKSSEWVEMNGALSNTLAATDDSSQQQSRFHVAKVSDDSKKENNVANVDGSGNALDVGEEDDDGAISPLGAQRTLGNTNSYYDTKNLKSLRYYTRDALPRADHYRNILSVHGHLSRPTLDELHGGQATIAAESNKVSDGRCCGCGLNGATPRHMHTRA